MTTTSTAREIAQRIEDERNRWFTRYDQVWEVCRHRDGDIVDPEVMATANTGRGAESSRRALMLEWCSQIVLTAADAEGAGPPEGWRLVPVEADSRMATAWEYAYSAAPTGSGHALAWEAAYTAMLAASPSPPSAGDRVGLTEPNDAQIQAGAKVLAAAGHHHGWFASPPVGSDAIGEAEFYSIVADVLRAAAILQELK